MTTFGIMPSVASVVVATGVSLWMRHLGSTARRDQPKNLERLQRFLYTGPYKNLD